ncbi:MAG: sigma-70 family RNA polymerase sigma factor, partial [Thermoleophilia bacterium]|nr:sigma-70 family RNA polymerase sigma factor [Thermoleophilia bacterium]
MDEPEPRALVEHFFRHESGRLVALLTRSLGVGRLDLVEDVVQASLLQALQTWSRRGIPDDPAAWLYRAARNRAIDALRRSRVHAETLPKLAAGQGDEAPEADPALFPDEIGDEPLRLLFLCCHEAVPVESRVALALRTVCGFSTPEVARALLTTEANAQKRIARAKERLRDEPGAWEAPGLAPLRGRLDAVLAVIYLLFNEGYHATDADEPIRRDLCDEARRLALMLAHHPVGDDPRVFALLALIGFHAARFDARRTPAGALVLLDAQDRSAWDWALIRDAMGWMTRSARGDAVSRYHIEAAIAWEHARAPRFEETDWPRIAALYEALGRVAPSPLQILNLAIAEAHRDGPRAGLERLERVDPATIPADYP